jgi:hypothetical protein
VLIADYRVLTDRDMNDLLAPVRARHAELAKDPGTCVRCRGTPAMGMSY